MITEFTDWHPTLSGVIIALLFTALPAAFLFLMGLLFGEAVNAAKIVVFYALAVQLVLCFKVERPILVMLPFIIMLAGLLVADLVYVISMGLRPPGMGPSFRAYAFSSALVTVFGAELGGIAGGLLIRVFASFVNAFRT